MVRDRGRDRRRSYYKEQCMLGVPEDRKNHERTSRNGQESRCRLCCTLRMTEVDGRSSQRRHLSEYRQRRLGVTGISWYRFLVMIINPRKAVMKVTEIEVRTFWKNYVKNSLLKNSTSGIIWLNNRLFCKEVFFFHWPKVERNKRIVSQALKYKSCCTQCHNTHWLKLASSVPR